MNVFPKCEIMIGDVRAKLREIATELIQCVVTSPPYWGLRDYGVEGQIGLEHSPAAFVQALVGVFQEVKRVLKKDGTVWLNMGDSYAGSGRGGYAGDKSTLDGTHDGQEESRKANRKLAGLHEGAVGAGATGRLWVPPPEGMREKNLIGVPWRLAFALQDDGWNLRQDIIWSKPNPMPESVLDRCTKAHEYIFLLTKSVRYFFDADAIAEPAAPSSDERLGRANSGYAPPGQKPHSGVMSPRENLKKSGNRARRRRPGPSGTGKNQPGSVPWEGSTRNKRSVWTVPVVAYQGAHYATFPKNLIRPCILAGSSTGDTVLDPFGGSGTTGAVANEYGRNAILIDLNPANEALMRDRLAGAAGQGIMTL